MNEEIKIPVKIILYKDMIGTEFNKIVPIEEADSVLMTLLLDGYMDVQFAFQGTPQERMWYLGTVKE
jgi:hypothetical protein